MARKPLRLRDQLIRSFMGVGLLRALSIPISLGVSVILARSLGPNLFGQYAFIMALVPLLVFPVANGLPQVLTREVAKFVQKSSWGAYRGILRFSYSWVFGYSVLVVVTVWAVFSLGSASSIAEKWRLLPLATLLVPLTGLVAVMQGATQGMGHVALSEVPGQFVRQLAFLIVVAVLALTGPMSPGDAIAGQIIATAIGFAAGAYILHSKRPATSVRSVPTYEAHTWSRALLWLTLVAVVGTLNARIAILLLGFIHTNESVGTFQVAESAAKLVTMSLVLVNMVIAPQIVKFRLNEDRENLQLLSRQSARAAFAIAAPIAVAYFVLGEQIIRWLFGIEYAQTVFWPLVILAAGHLLSSFVGSVGPLLVMSDREMDLLGSQAVALAVNVLACAILIPPYGAIGAALGMVAGVVAWNVLVAIKVYTRLGIRPTAL